MKIRFKSMALVCGALFIILLPQILKAAPYYVSINGSNSNDGASLDSAWKTISYAVGRVKPGDTIYIVPGDYGNELIHITINGTESDPINLTRYGSSGEIVLTSVGSMIGTCISVSADYWNINYIHTKNYYYGILVNTGAEYNTFKYCVTEGDGDDSGVIKVEYRGFYIRGNNNRFENCAASGIGNKGKDERNFGYGSGVRIEGDYNYLLNFKAWSNGHFGIAIDNEPDNPAVGNVVDGGEFWDIPNDTAVAAADTRDTTIKNVIAHDCQSAFRAYDVADNTTIRDCEVYNMSKYGVRMRSKGLVSNIKMDDNASGHSGIDNWGGSDVVYDRLNIFFTEREYEFRGYFSNTVIRDQVNLSYRILTMDNYNGERCGSPVIEYTSGRVFEEESGTATSVYFPDKSYMVVPVGDFATWTIKAYEMYVRPTAGSAAVTVNKFNHSLGPGNVLIDFDTTTSDNNTVVFTISALKPDSYYLVKKDGVEFKNLISNTEGNLSFENSEWMESHNFTLEESMIVTCVDDYESGPSILTLSQNFPNPFNPSTTIQYKLESAGWVSLKVYNVYGQEICTLVNGNKDVGNYTVTFDSNNFANGIYFYRLENASSVLIKKFVCIK